jgi:hypothetical protein
MEWYSRMSGFVNLSVSLGIRHSDGDWINPAPGPYGADEGGLDKALSVAGPLTRVLPGTWRGAVVEEILLG